MADSALKSETARAVKEAHEIMARMRTVTFASVRAEEQSRRAIRDSRDLLATYADGGAGH